MPGGIWTSQNKVRPGAYINFEGEPQVDISLGERGIATFVMPLNWGGEGSLIAISALDLIQGNTLAKVGLNYKDAGALPLRLALSNCALVKIYNSYTGGVAATKTIATTGGDGLVVTAKHPGTFGNKIAIKITVTSGTAVVETYADGYFVDRQTVASDAIDSLVANDYVTFSGDGTLQTTVSTLLEGGTNGNIPSNLYTNFFNKLRNEIWNTVAVTSEDVNDLALAIQTIQDLRDNEGMYVQAVIANGTANYEGIINVVSGVNLYDGTAVAAKDFTVWVAGATAGAYLTESLTGKVVDGAASIISQLSNSEIIDALNAGKFVLAVNQNGTIRVEKDINSLHEFTPTKGYAFSKNRVIRELDEIGSSIKNIWETTYLGKISNNDSGRALFKSSIISYLNRLQDTGAITEFNPESVIVEQGDAVDAVYASIAVKPVDSMEFLYMTVTIS